MIRIVFSLLTLLFFISCAVSKPRNTNVITSDIDLFWKVYDQIINEKDSAKQVALIQKEYIDRGSIGLEKIIEVRNYSPELYVELINKYPKYWNSIRANTLKANSLAGKLNDGITNFKNIYPSMRPAKMYFTIGGMLTNGTTRDSLVLIGSELAMGDSKTDISEFEGQTKDWLLTYFGSNPIEGLVLLNVHEFVHTQQKPIPDNMLHQVFFEGIAEFISVKAMNRSSDAPAIEFGKSNPQVKKSFEKEVFMNRMNDWMWSSSPNKFGVRDLGYYIGYSIAEIYYIQSPDKEKAIASLIELDYSDPLVIDKFIDQTNFFSKSITQLRNDYDLDQPTVIDIAPFKNGSQLVDVNTKQLTIQFSEPMLKRRNFDYGPLGEEAVVRFKQEIGYSDNDTRYSFEIEPLLPNKRYQITIGSGFQDKSGIPLKPYLIDFRTGN